MAKKQLNIKVSELTRHQLHQLCIRWGTSQTETVTVLIDRAARERAEKDDTGNLPDSQPENK